MEKGITQWKRIYEGVAFKFLIFLMIYGTSFVKNVSAQTLTQGDWEYEISSDGSMPEHRHENAYVKSGNKFYLLGSRGIKKVQIYDPTFKIWIDGASVPVEMNHFQAIDYNGKIYVVGAFTGGFPTETPLPNIYIYDPSTNTWTTGPEIPADRRRGSGGTVVYNHKIYWVSGIVNGHTSGHVPWFDEFDPATGTWKTLPDAPHSRDHFHAAVVGNKIVLAGGRNSSYPNTFGITIDDVDIYDFATGTWSTGANKIPTPRAGAAVAVLGVEVVVIGGESSAHFEAHNESEAYNVSTGTWRPLALLNQGRHGTQAIVHENQIYIVAGSKTRGGNASTELDSQEMFSMSAIVQANDVSKPEVLFSYYPNPFQDTFMIRGQIEIKKYYIVSIYNTKGEKVKEFKTYLSSDLEVSMPGSPEGVYYINITDDQENTNQSVKLVKK